MSDETPFVPGPDGWIPNLNNHWYYTSPDGRYMLAAWLDADSEYLWQVFDSKAPEPLVAQGGPVASLEDAKTAVAAALASYQAQLPPT